MFPIPGYRPLQAPPAADLRKAVWLAEAVANAFAAKADASKVNEKVDRDDSSTTADGEEDDAEAAATLKSPDAAASGAPRWKDSGRSSPGLDNLKSDGSRTDSDEIEVGIDAAPIVEEMQRVEGSLYSVEIEAAPDRPSTTDADLPRAECGDYEQLQKQAALAAAVKEGVAAAAEQLGDSVPPLKQMGHAPSDEMLRLICVSHAMRALMPLLSPYVFHHAFVRKINAPLIMRSPELIPELINILQAVLGLDAFRQVVALTLFETADFVACNTPWTGCDFPLKFVKIFLCSRPVVAALCCCPEGMIHKIMSGLFTTKLLSVHDAEVVFPKVWWKTAPDDFADDVLDASTASSGGASAALDPCGPRNVEFNERLQFFSRSILSGREQLHAITRSMLEDAEPFPAAWLVPTKGMDRSIQPAPIADSPRGLFEWWMAKLVKLNLGLTRQVIPVGTSDHTILCNVQSVLSRVFVDRIAEQPEELADLEAIMDYAGTVCAPHDLPRLGGLYSVLKAEYDKGVAKGTIVPPAKTPELTLPFQLLDWSVILFSLSMVNPLRQLTNAHLEVTRAMDEEQNALTRLHNCNKDASPDVLAVLEQGVDASRKRVMSLIRSVCLFEVAYMDTAKAAVFEKWSGTLAALMLQVQKSPHFDFAPEAHFAVVLHAFTVIHTESALFCEGPRLPYFVRTESSKAWLRTYARLLIALVSDGRVKSPDLNVTVIAKVKALLGVPEYLRFLEQDEEICRGMLEILMKCFNDRFWVPSTDILVRLWDGLGFGGHRTFGKPEKEPAVRHGSKIMRDTFQDMCADSQDMLATYLNHLINHLNWTVSEFDQMLEEIRRIGDRPDRGSDQVFRRCIVTHTLGTNLLRLLEAVATSGKQMLLSHDDPTNLTRVVQLMVHLLNRLTGNDQLIDSVLALNLMPLQYVHKQALADPILGTLFVLVGDVPDVESLTKAKIEANPALNAIMRDGGFTPKLLESLAALADNLDGELASASGGGGAAAGSSAASGGADERAQLLLFCKVMETSLAVWEAAETAEDEDDDDNLCSICYAYPLNATFSPCQHRSCTGCIKRHLLNSQKCFFCNAEIGSVNYGESAVEESVGAGGVDANNGD